MSGTQNVFKDSKMVKFKQCFCTSYHETIWYCFRTANKYKMNAPDHRFSCESFPENRRCQTETSGTDSVFL